MLRKAKNNIKGIMQYIKWNYLDCFLGYYKYYCIYFAIHIIILDSYLNLKTLFTSNKILYNISNVMYLFNYLLTYILTYLHNYYLFNYILTYLLTYLSTYIFTYIFTYILTYSYLNLKTLFTLNKVLYNI